MFPISTSIYTVIINNEKHMCVVIVMGHGRGSEEGGKGIREYVVRWM